MTIKEVQELIGFIDEKSGRVGAADRVVDKEDICKRFCETIRDANDAGIDMTEVLVDSLADKKK